MKRVFSLLLALTLVLSAFTTAFAAGDKPWSYEIVPQPGEAWDYTMNIPYYSLGNETDYTGQVPKWAKPLCEKLNIKKWETDPNRPITRGEYVILIHRCAVQSVINQGDESGMKSSAEKKFVDISDFRPEFQNLISNASDMGMIKGNDKGEALLDNNITRAEAASITYNSAKAICGAFPPKLLRDYPENKFKDVKESNVHYDNIVESYECGYMNGASSNSFNVNGNLSVIEAIQIVQNMTSINKTSRRPVDITTEALEKAVFKTIACK